MIAIRSHVYAPTIHKRLFENLRNLKNRQAKSEINGMLRHRDSQSVSQIKFPETHEYAPNSNPIRDCTNVSGPIYNQCSYRKVSYLSHLTVYLKNGKIDTRTHWFCGSHNFYTLMCVAPF